MIENLAEKVDRVRALIQESVGSMMDRRQVENLLIAFDRSEELRDCVGEILDESFKQEKERLKVVEAVRPIDEHDHADFQAGPLDAPEGTLQDDEPSTLADLPEGQSDIAPLEGGESSDDEQPEEPAPQPHHKKNKHKRN